MANDRLLVSRWRLALRAASDPSFSRADVGVLMVILDHMDKAGEAWPGLTRIGELARVDRSHVTRCIRKLTETGYLDREAGNQTKSNRYRIGRVGRCTDAPRGKCSPAPTGRCTDASEVGAALASGVGAALHPEPALKSNLPIEPTGKAPASASLILITRAAITAFNASRLVITNGGKLATVTDQGIETKAKWIKRSLSTVREMCQAMNGSPEITPEFWEGYFEEIEGNPWKRGDGPYTGGHANWRPSFEYLTRPDVMTAVWDEANADAA